MVSWWQREVIDPIKLPLMLCFLAFVITFVVTRIVTRMIRSGRGPFRNQVTSSGVHIHHAVPGIVLLIIGAFTAVGDPASLAWRSFAAVAVGTGVSLVLDEFALILHLQDVYWTGEGRISVEAVSLTAACLGLALAGFSPFGMKTEISLRLTATGAVFADGLLALICVLKGKYRTGLFGIFLPPIAVVGALRLARPSSIWARYRYRGRRLERATRRAAAFDRRWTPLQTHWVNFAGGKPHLPSPRRPNRHGDDVRDRPPRLLACRQRRIGRPSGSSWPPAAFDAAPKNRYAQRGERGHHVPAGLRQVRRAHCGS